MTSTTICVSSSAGLILWHFTATQAGQSELYILADITVPGGAPPGQQNQLNELTFNFTLN